MAKLGTTILNPLPYGIIRREANKATIDGLTAAAAGPVERANSAAAFLGLSPDLTPDQIDAASPNDLLKAALALFADTFYRPEGSAPSDPASPPAGATSQG